MRLGLGNNLVKTAFPIGTSPSLDLAFALDRSFTTDPVAPGGALITSRRGPAAKFSRGSGATQVNAAGLIEYAPENLLLRSQDQSSTATWPALNSATREANSSLGLDGTQSATKIIFGSLASSLIFQGYTAPSTVNTPLTLSIWVSSATNKKFRLAIFAASQSHSADLTSTPTLTRYSFTVANPNATGINAVIANESAGGAGEIVIWGAQLERASTARTYNPTTSAAFYGPRFDHDPATGACKGLLIEESRTNFITRSEELNDASWTKSQVTVNENTTTSPSGIVDADKVVESTALSIHRIVKGSLSAIAGTVYSVSVYAKADGRRYLYLNAGGFGSNSTFDLESGVVSATQNGTASITNAGNGWWRCVTTGTAATTQTTVVNFQLNNTSTASDSSYTGDGTSGLYLWGAQLEAGAFPTSYIPTTVGTAARSADVCSIVGTDFSSFYNQNEGTLFAEHYRGFKQGGIATIGLGGIDSGKIQIFQISGALGTIEATIKSADNSVIFLNTFPPISGVNKTSLGYKLNDAASSCNGSVASTDNNVVMDSTRTVLIIGSDAIDRRFGGHIARIQYFRKRLSNAKLQTITTL